MAVKKQVYIDTSVYRNQDSLEKMMRDSYTTVKRNFADVDIDLEEYVVEQKVIIRNTIIRRKKK